MQLYVLTRIYRLSYARHLPSIILQISGDNFGLGLGDWFSLVDKKKVARIVRQAGGVIMLFPDKDFWNNTELVKTPTRSYTPNDYAALFQDVGSPVRLIVFTSSANILF